MVTLLLRRGKGGFFRKPRPYHGVYIFGMQGETWVKKSLTSGTERDGRARKLNDKPENHFDARGWQIGTGWKKGSHSKKAKQNLDLCLARKKRSLMQ